MIRTRKNPQLDIFQLADLYIQLARMEEAGISHVQAFEYLIEAGNSLSARLYKAINYLKSGRPIAESGYRAGIFNELDRELITAGEFSGKLGDI